MTPIRVPLQLPGHSIARNSSCRFVGHLLKLQMHPKSRCEYRSAVAVVSGVVDVLHIKCGKQPAPHMGVVVVLDNGLAPVIERAISEQKTAPTECQITLMVGLDGVGHKYRPRLVEFSPPTVAGI